MRISFTNLILHLVNSLLFVLQGPAYAEGIGSTPQQTNHTFRLTGHSTKVNTLIYRSLPGRIEAEEYDAMSGVKTETTADQGGGLNVGWLDTNDWMDYNVNVASAGSYTVQLRVACNNGSGRLELRTEGGAVLSALDVPSSGGWQIWTTLTTTVTLNAGNQVLRVYVVRGQGDWNLNRFDVNNTTVVQSASVINFSDLPERSVSNNPFELIATSNNTEKPITFVSSNPAIVSVSNATGKYMAVAVAQGSAIITASQAGSTNFLTASDVSKTQVIKAVSSSLANKIPIDGKRWYQLNTVSNGLEGLFNGVTNTTVFTGWGKILTNYDAYYPLADGEQMTIESIRLYDGEGSMADSPMRLYVITNDWKRVEIASFTGEQYNNWVGPYPNRDTNFKLDNPIQNARYLVINANWGYPTEIELYGTYVAGNQPTTPTAKSPLLKDMFGVNAFEWDFEESNSPWEISEAKLKAVKNFSAVRHYMDWEKLENEQGSYTYNPVRSGGWNYDAIYERCKQEGISLLACLKTVPGWLLNSYPNSEKDSENVPVSYGRDFTDPRSYIEQARVAFQYVARYGSNKNVDRSLLSVNSTPRWTNDGVNTIKVGLDLINYIECDNERDKWWKGRKAYQTGREYAANMSAFYDGHKNTMGTGIGVKNADPNMQVVVGGLASAYAGTDYVAGMIDWCKEYRGYKANGQVNLCWDVINYHLYSDNANSSQSGQATQGVAPEIGPAKSVAQKFIKLAHDAAYDMPVWITETGYDINQGSPIRAVPIDNKSAAQTQADWILRTSLLYARSGIDRVFFYQLYSDNAANAAQFSSSGLINADKSPTIAANFLAQASNLLGNYRYKETINSDPLVDRYELNGQSAYALVVPDQTNRTATYVIDLGSNITDYKMYMPSANGDKMSPQSGKTNGGKVTIKVTETPLFIVPDAPGSARVGVQPEKTDDTSDPLSTLQVYPNPATEQIIISLYNERVDNVEITIYDAGSGRLYRQFSLPKKDHTFLEHVDMTSLRSGTYLIEVKQSRERSLRKIIKVR